MTARPRPQPPELDPSMTPEERADAILATVDFDPLGRSLANVLHSAWVNEQAAAAREERAS